MSDGNGEAVRVEIFGEEYTIRSETDEEHTRACAHHVDEAIREAHLRSHVSEPHRAAILAAMEITDELLRTRDELERTHRDVAERLRSLRNRVEESLPG